MNVYPPTPSPRFLIDFGEIVNARSSPEAVEQLWFKRKPVLYLTLYFTSGGR